MEVRDDKLYGVDLKPGEKWKRKKHREKNERYRLDQTRLVLLGETHGRRDYVFIYDGLALKAVVKNKYKMHLPPPGTNPIGAAMYDLYRDPREERPEDSVKYGVWAGGQFANMVMRHMAYKRKYADRPPTHGMPYEGIENLRPETKQLLRIFAMGLPGK